MKQLSSHVAIVVDDVNSLDTETLSRYLPEKVPFRLAISDAVESQDNNQANATVVNKYFGDTCILH